MRIVPYVFEVLWRKVSSSYSTVLILLSYWVIRDIYAGIRIFLFKYSLFTMLS